MNKIRVYVLLLIGAIISNFCAPQGITNHLVLPQNATAVTSLKASPSPTSVAAQPAVTANINNGYITVGVFPVPGNQSNFNPLFTGANWIASRLLYAPGGSFDFNSGKFEYALAKSISYSPDNKVLSFNLRDGLKWSDGSSITAVDVIYTLRALASNQNLDGLATATLVSNVDHIDQVGQNEISVYFKEANILDAYNILSQPIINLKTFQQASIQDLDKFTNSNPVVSGPYRVSQVDRNGVTLIPNPYYFGASLKIKGLYFPNFADRNQFNDAIASNKLDLWETTENTAGPANSKIIPVYNSELNLFFNTASKQFSDINVRTAISQAIDRAGLMQIRPGSIEPEQSGLLPQDREFYPSQAGQKLDYSPDQAAKRLDQAGYKAGSNGSRVNPDGSELKIDIQVIDTRQDIAELVSKDLQKIGINAPVKVVDLRTFYTNLQTGAYSLAIAPVFFTDSYPEAFYFYYQSLSIPPQTQIFTNWSQFHSPAADELLNQWKNSRDPQSWPAISDSLAKLYAEGLPSSPLLIGSAYVGFSTSRFSHWPDAIQANLYGVNALSFLSELEPSQ